WRSSSCSTWWRTSCTRCSTPGSGMPDNGDRDRDREEIERVPAAGQPLPIETLTEPLSDDVEVTEGETGGVRRIEVVLTTRQLAWRRFKRHRLAIVSLVILFVLGLLTLLVDVISQYDFAQQNLFMRVKPPSRVHWFGTDQL